MLPRGLGLEMLPNRATCTPQRLAPAGVFLHWPACEILEWCVSGFLLKAVPSAALD